MYRKYCLVSCVLMILFSQVYALDLELTQGQKKALPIAMVPFKNDDGSQLTSIIQKDLERSGAFNFLDFQKDQNPHDSIAADVSYWRSIGAHNLIVGSIDKKGSEWSVHYQLLDPISQTRILLSQEYKIPSSHFRSLAHHISDQVYQKLTGHKGIFSTRLAYIVVNRSIPSKPMYQLDVSDYDGADPKTLLRSSQPIMSPSWSPDAKKIAYVSFENKKSEIYVVNVNDGKRRLVSSFSGINGAPTWSPNGEKLAIVLSKSGSPNIYLHTFSNGHWEALTKGGHINTEPSFIQDGKSLIFTSNRGGSPQIYKIDLKTKKTSRLTYAGNYNASASYTPSQKSMISLHRSNNAFAIALHDLSSGLVTPLTFSKYDESPSLSPNGEMVVYASKYKNKGVLKIASLDANVNFKLPFAKGDMQEPAWSPFL